ncbi:MAG: hypothetical protein WCG87_12390 [Bacteroidota bacterium]
MSARKAALIEIDGSHDECLYSQLLFLKKGNYHTTLICSENLRARVKDFDAADENIFFDFENTSEWQRLKLIWQIRKYIVSHDIDTIIFNSTHGRTIRNLTLLPYPSGTRMAGTLHGINKLKGSLTQKIISKQIGNYYLLNDYLVENLKLVPHKGLHFQSFYPIFFPKFGSEPQVSKNAHEIWIGIPGHIEYKRRDYETLVRSFAAMPQKPNYKFLLLGNGDHTHGNGTELRSLIEELGVSEHFIFWHGYMANDEFHARLKLCDAIMPLIHPINEDLKKYLNDQISGSYNLAFAYKKPLLMHRYFEKYADFQENALFYDMDNMGTVLAQFPILTEQQKGHFYQNPKWSLEYQAEKYLSLLQ